MEELQKYIERIYKTLLLILIFSLSVISCNNKEKKDEIDDKKFDETLIRINKFLVKEDEDRIKNYIKRHGWTNMKKTEAGLFYDIYEHGNGDSVQTGDIVTMNFRVELLDGTLCYSSDSLGPKKFKVGQGGVETGLERGILMMRKGDKARFIMPPYMAHGLLGDMFKIPPRSIIVYDCELLDITRY